MEQGSLSKVVEASKTRRGIDATGCDDIEENAPNRYAGNFHGRNRSTLVAPNAGRWKILLEILYRMRIVVIGIWVMAFAQQGMGPGRRQLARKTHAYGAVTIKLASCIGA